LRERDLLPADGLFIDDPLPAIIPLAIVFNGSILNLLTTVSAFGTPLDVTLQELHIEMSFPADDPTDRFRRCRRYVARAEKTVPGGQTRHLNSEY